MRVQAFKGHMILYRGSLYPEGHTVTLQPGESASFVKPPNYSTTVTLTWDGAVLRSRSMVSA